MNERILVPLDGSEVGESALKHVKMFISKLSPQTQVEVTLLHVLRMQTPIATGDYLAGVPILLSEEETEADKKGAMDYLHSVGESLKSTNVTILVKVAIGYAAEEIARTANEINADIIAMSTHGRSGLSRWAFGSVTNRVLRSKDTKPVLLIRAPKKGN
jgi:nucleotide-binding universal stress UspA family protein